MYDNDAVRDLYWIEGEGLYVGKYNCSVCGGVYTGCDHAEKVKYTAVADDLTVINAGGNYYLTKSLETTAQLSVAENASIVLDLNGKELSRSGRVLALNKAGSLTITDTVGTGAVKSATDAADNGFVVNVNNESANLILYAGTLDGSGVTGGAIGMYNKSQVSIEGGTVVSGTAPNGSAIYVPVGGTLTLKNTTIESNSTAATVWNCGVVTMAGTVSMPADVLDVMVDARNGESYLDVAELTSTGETPITVSRWIADTAADDTGLIAINAAASQIELFASEGNSSYVTCVEDQIILKTYLIQGRSRSVILSGYNSWEEAMSDTAEGVTYYALAEDVDGGTITKDIILDLAGNNLTNVTIAEGVTVYGMDSTTDDYDCADGYGTISGTINGTISTNLKTTTAQTGAVKRYLTVTENGVTSFHRFYMGITHMTVRPGVNGVGYKAVFSGDSVVGEQVASYGYNLWVGDGSKYTASKAELVSGNTVSLRLENFDVENYGEAAVNATVFMQFANGVAVESDAYSYTLRSLLETINGSVSSFTDAQMTALQTMCQKYTETMAQWDVANILNWKATETN